MAPTSVSEQDHGNEKSPLHLLNKGSNKKNSKSDCESPANFSFCTQVILVFHKPFWPDPEALGGHIGGDLPLKIMYYPYVASKTGTVI